VERVHFGNFSAYDQLYPCADGHKRPHMGDVGQRAGGGDFLLIPLRKLIEVLLFSNRIAPVGSGAKSSVC
jgi:hypothetical protein